MTKTVNMIFGSIRKNLTTIVTGVIVRRRDAMTEQRNVANR